MILITVSGSEKRSLFLGRSSPPVSIGVTLFAAVSPSTVVSMLDVVSLVFVMVGLVSNIFVTTESCWDPELRTDFVDNLRWRGR